MPVADAELRGEAEPQPASERTAAVIAAVAAVVAALAVRFMGYVVRGRWCQYGDSACDPSVTSVRAPLEYEMRVLVVDDHRRLATAIAAGLRNEGIAVDVVFDGAQALAQAAVYRYDVVVLDRDLPGVHGDEVCRRWSLRRATAVC